MITAIWRDGMPHFSQINEAFNRHGIGSGLYTQYNYTHVPVADYPAPAG